MKVLDFGLAKALEPASGLLMITPTPSPPISVVLNWTSTLAETRP